MIADVLYAADPKIARWQRHGTWYERLANKCWTTMHTRGAYHDRLWALKERVWDQMQLDWERMWPSC